MLPVAVRQESKDGDIFYFMTFCVASHEKSYKQLREIVAMRIKTK